MGNPTALMRYYFLAMRPAQRRAFLHAVADRVQKISAGNPARECVQHANLAMSYVDIAQRTTPGINGWRACNHACSAVSVDTVGRAPNGADYDAIRRSAWHAERVAQAQMAKAACLR